MERLDEAGGAEDGRTRTIISEGLREVRPAPAREEPAADQEPLLPHPGQEEAGGKEEVGADRGGPAEVHQGHPGAEVRF